MKFDSNFNFSKIFSCIHEATIHIQPQNSEIGAFITKTFGEASKQLKTAETCYNKSRQISSTKHEKENCIQQLQLVDKVFEQMHHNFDVVKKKATNPMDQIALQSEDSFMNGIRQCVNWTRGEIEKHLHTGFPTGNYSIETLTIIKDELEQRYAIKQMEKTLLNRLLEFITSDDKKTTNVKQLREMVTNAKAYSDQIEVAVAYALVEANEKEQNFPFDTYKQYIPEIKRNRGEAGIIEQLLEASNFSPRFSINLGYVLVLVLSAYFFLL